MRQSVRVGYTIHLEIRLCWNDSGERPEELELVKRRVDTRTSDVYGMIVDDMDLMTG
jgi:hypothetical protein